VKVLVAYASKHGATAEIAEAIAEVLRSSGHDTDVAAAEIAPAPDGYEAVVLGSALYAGSWLEPATTYARTHADTIAGLPAWLFSSGPLGEPEPPLADQPAELDELARLLQPRWHTLFAGRYDPDVLGYGEQAIMTAVKAAPGDYRNWDRIRRWAGDVAAELSGGGD
jgi:menaquinone-dependent protoporphyrinogen oxidase